MVTLIQYQNSRYYRRLCLQPQAFWNEKRCQCLHFLARRMSEFDFMVAAVLYGSQRPSGLCMPSTWTHHPSSWPWKQVLRGGTLNQIMFFKRSSYCGKLVTPNFTSSPLVLFIHSGMPQNAIGRHCRNHHVLHSKLVLRNPSVLTSLFLVLTIAILNRRIPSWFRLPLTYCCNIHTLLQLYTHVACLHLAVALSSHLVLVPNNPTICAPSLLDTTQTARK